MAVRLARLFAECGNKVILGSRTPERAEHITTGLGIASIKPGSYEMAADASVVLPSMFLRDGSETDLHVIGKVGWQPLAQTDGPRVRHDFENVGEAVLDRTLLADIPELFPTCTTSEREIWLGPVLWSPSVPLPEWWNDLPAGPGPL